ncbi:MAG: hypothetical protein RLZZ517_17 [Candidatus Parcubacteria bacterium]|jgi:ABC-type transport system involved in multi-copper enzyme maturation permease subunit
MKIKLALWAFLTGGVLLSTLTAFFWRDLNLFFVIMMIISAIACFVGSLICHLIVRISRSEEEEEDADEGFYGQ